MKRDSENALLTIRMPWRVALAWALWSSVALSLAASANAAADVAPVPQPAAKDKQGLILTIQSLASGAKMPVPDAHAARLVSLYVPANSPPSPFAPPGAFRATFEGDLTLRLRDYYGFFAQGRGKLTLTLNGQVVLQSAGEDLAKVKAENIRLNKGKNHLVAVYESGGGDSWLRMFWTPKGQAPEPLPPAILSHDAHDAALREGERVREGRFLIAQLRCTRCHAAGVTPAGAGAMPELSQDAPSLADVGARLNEDWLAAWINDPRAMRAGVHMPRVFQNAGDGNAMDPRARDVAAYLATLGSPQGNAAPDPEKAQAGGRIFAALNCIACHRLTPVAADAPNAAEDDRVSLARVKAKFKPAALKQFLLKPEAHYAWISMPNFRLSNDEGESIAAFLLSSSLTPGPAMGAGNPQNGRKLIASAGCTACHAMDTNAAGPASARAEALDSIAAANWPSGCMAAKPEDLKSAPNFGLTPKQREAILAFSATDHSSLKRDTPSEFSARQMATLRCGACHGRDGNDSLLATVLDAENQELKARHPRIEPPGSEGFSPDQRAPILTWAGEKLLPGWMGEFIAGRVGYKPRYYLVARMPGFASRATGIAAGLAQEHGCAPGRAPYRPANADLAAVGQKLAGAAPNESLGCIRCHAIGPQPPTAPFEAPAPNFAHATERLRRDYYDRWMHNPLRVDPETKMPRFDDDQGKTGITAVLDGDAKQQFEAIWNYMLAGKDIQPPAQ